MKNLVNIFRNTTDKTGMGWYREAHNFCKDLASNYNLPLNRVCGVVSALSPGTSWGQNKKDAINLIESFLGSEKKFKFTTYGQNVVKALKILKGPEAPETFFNQRTGAKTYNFYFNILMPENPEYVTIDRHAYVIATGQPYKALTPKVYRTVAEHYQRAAKRLGILPAELQAVLWTAYRTEQFTGTKYEHLLGAV